VAKRTFVWSNCLTQINVIRISHYKLPSYADYRANDPSSPFAGGVGVDLEIRHIRT
jgi:hypothetical protein